MITLTPAYGRDYKSARPDGGRIAYRRGTVRVRIVVPEPDWRDVDAWLCVARAKDGPITLAIHREIGPDGDGWQVTPWQSDHGLALLSQPARTRDEAARAAMDRVAAYLSGFLMTGKGARQ